MRNLVWLLWGLLVACTSSPPAESPSVPASKVEPVTVQKAAPDKDLRDAPLQAEVPRGKPGSLLAKIDRGLLSAQMHQTPKPINIKLRCSFRNETGYNGSTMVEIVNNEVKALATQIQVPLYGGSCAFDGPGFRQLARSPSIELQHADGCTVRIWTQGRQLTISYSKCAAHCSNAEVFKYIWPVLIDQPSGKCD
jgi:hypothetical protein